MIRACTVQLPLSFIFVEDKRNKEEAPWGHASMYASSLRQLRARSNENTGAPGDCMTSRISGAHGMFFAGPARGRIK